MSTEKTYPQSLIEIVEKLSKEEGVVAIYGYGPYFSGDIQSRDLYLMVLVEDEAHAWGIKGKWYWDTSLRVEGRKVYVRAESDDPAIYETAEPSAVKLWSK